MKCVAYMDEHGHLFCIMAEISDLHGGGIAETEDDDIRSDAACNKKSDSNDIHVFDPICPYCTRAAEKFDQVPG